MSKQALEGQRLNAFGCDPNDLIIVGIDTKDGPEHPLWQHRLEMLPSTITEEWVQNITMLGVCEPVLVRKNGDRIEVVVGRRRVLGARIANQRLLEAGQPPMLVTCMVRRNDDKTLTAVVAAENEARVDDTAIVKAKTIARLLDRGHSVEGAALAMCIPVSELQRLVPLLDLADEVQQMIADRKLGQTVALSLRDLPRDAQITKAKEFIANGATVEDARQQTALRKAKKNGHAAPTTAKRPKPAFLRKLAADDDFRGGLSSDARALLDFINGDETAARRVKGLTARLGAAGTKNLLQPSADDAE